MSPFFGNSDSPSSNGQRKRLFISYAPDWILTIVLVAAFYFLNKVDGFKREFSVTDTSLRFPYTVHERVPDLALFFIAFVAPLVLQWVINILTTRSRWDAHTSALGRTTRLLPGILLYPHRAQWSSLSLLLALSHKLPQLQSAAHVQIFSIAAIQTPARSIHLLASPR
jgi:hypothetical protein